MEEAQRVATDPDMFRRLYGTGENFPPDRASVMRAAFVVDPTGFRVNEDSATDNHYMECGVRVDLERAHAQHAEVVATLTRIGVPAIVFPGREGLDDGVYPNNVFGTIPRRFIVGRMLHPVRQREAERADVRELFTTTFGYELWDLSAQSLVAELTGPLVIDRARGIGWCGRTRRVDDAGVRALHQAFDLRITLSFDLVPTEYHTNLVLSVLAGRGCVAHRASFGDPEVVDALRTVYPDHTLLLSDEEKDAFAGNCLAVTESDLVFSESAARALRPASRRTLESWGFRLHPVAVDELEKGGGSLRCLIAEVF